MIKSYIVISVMAITLLCQCSQKHEHSEDIYPSLEFRSTSPGNTTYYIDPLNGNDTNSGLKENRAWRTFRPVNHLLLSSGDRLEITSPGSFDQTLLLMGEGAVDTPVRVNFAPGRYDFFPENIYKEKYNISNTNGSPDSLKAVGILLKHAKNFEISGVGAEIIFRGKMIEVCIDSCTNVSIADLHFDYHRPTVSEYKVVAAGDDYADIKIHKDSKYRIENGNLIWYGEGWTCNTPLLGQELNLETNDVRRLWDPLKEMRFEEIEPNLVRANGDHKVKLGRVYQLRETFRDYAAVFTRRSKGISWKNVNFHFLHGMGLVNQFSENLTFDNVTIAPDSSSGRTTAAWADCIQISGCKGKIEVKNCRFEGAHDDAINIHGTYLRVVERISDTSLKLRFMHKQTYGFLAVNPGDEIELINHESYKSYGLNKVKEASLINPKEIIISLEESVPEELGPKDVIENVTWTPEVEIRGCSVFRIPTRGFLVSTRRKVLIEENEFLATHMSGILMAIDANNWFESGYVHDLTIRNNKFILCAEPVILIEPGNSVPNNSVYRNIRIENNEFVLLNESIVKAKSTKNLSVIGNTIYSEKKLSDELSIKTSDCTEVELRRNNYLSIPGSKEIIRSGNTSTPHFWDEIPVSPSTTMPDKIKDDYWHGQYERVNQRVAQADNSEIVFFGNSITWSWTLGPATGKDVWKKKYSRHNPINMGNSGDITPVMLYRVTSGNLDFAKGQQPKVAVLLCGTNNFVVTQSAGGEVQWGLGADCPPAEVAHGVRAIAQVFRRQLPHTRVIMLGILPVSDTTKWAKCQQVNAVNSALSYNESEVVYLDLQDKFLQSDGSINKQLFTDGTHLTARGYRVWAKSLDDLVSGMIKADPLNPVKIMLIGGSITEGVNSGGAYRRYLDGMLRREGNLIDFVGSRKKHNDNQTEADNYQYDVDHEGHWGKNSDWLAKNISGLLDDNVPDVAVIQMGTEDIVSGSAIAESLTDEIIDNISKVIKSLRSKNRSVKIVLANIIPIQGKTEEVDLLNLKISRYIKAHSTDQSPILIADQNTGFDPTADLADNGLAPNATGAKKMASIFADVINEGNLLKQEIVN